MFKNQKDPKSINYDFNKPKSSPFKNDYIYKEKANQY